MTRRYYVPDLPLSGGLISLPESEAQHAVRVMRVQVGGEISLFDGKGNESRAEVTSVSQRECVCHAEAAEAIDRELTRHLHLGLALPKPDRARELTERLTELGVTSVTPLVAARTQRPPSVSLIGKLQRAVIESSKQCGRNQLMKIASPMAAGTFFETSQSESGERWIADPEGTPWRQMTERLPGQVIAAIGPEGGWTESELEAATTCGFEKVNLGKRIFRIETAATFISAILAD